VKKVLFVCRYCKASGGVRLVGNVCKDCWKKIGKIKLVKEKGGGE
jgi:hypothetical protein